jgi:hypothetical protein
VTLPGAYAPVNLTLQITRNGTPRNAPLIGFTVLTCKETISKDTIIEQMLSETKNSYDTCPLHTKYRK